MFVNPENGATLTLGSENGIEEVIAENTYDYPQIMSWPDGTFNNEMITSNETTLAADGNAFANGTKNDGVFSYDKDTSGPTTKYKRTHDAYLGTTIPESYAFCYSHFESKESYKADRSDIVLQLMIYGKNDTSCHRKLHVNSWKKPATGTVLSEASGASDLNVSFSESNNDYTYEGNDTVGYYWKPTNIDSCPENMKNIYEGILDGTWYKSNVAWTFDS
jgi:hypothetical protein